MRHGDHTHLAYALELPRQLGRVQHELKIEPQASYILTVKNPEQPSPPEVGLGEEQQPEFPVDLSAHFRKRRFGPGDPPDVLDQEGTEIILIGADEDVRGELGVSLDPERETMDTAEIFRDLHMEKSKHPLEPLFQGKWV